MARLELGLLGPFQVSLDGCPVEGLTSDRLRALLAYLAVERRREHSREALAALLWPERSDQEALSALRYALSNLRGILDDRGSSNPFLLVTRSTVQFNAASNHWLDVAEIENLAVRPDAPGLELALALYRGPLLDGLSVGDSPAFEQWLLLQGEETRRFVLSLHGRLIALQMARGAYAEAAHWARRQIELEPFREQAHRQLMAALALGGERSAALAHYAACRRVLVEELGCEPEDETQALHAQIRSGVLSWPSSPAHVIETPAPARAGVQPPAHFVARELQLARLEALLDDALTGQGGVAFIVGEAGAGKSALLDELARQAAESRGDLITLRGRCNAHAAAGDLYLPFREMLQMLAGDVEGKRAGGTLSLEQARRVWEALPTVVAALVEHGPALIDRFVPGEILMQRVGGYPASSSARKWQARLQEIVFQPGLRLGMLDTPPDLFAEVTEVLRTVSQRNPLLLSVDDLQWADGGTAALLFHLGRRLAGSHILLVCAYRPEELGSQPWPGAAHGEGDEANDPRVETIVHELCRLWGDVLVDLDKADGRAFVEALVDSEPNRLGVAFRRGLYDHTGGNPLFTVELLRGFEQAGALMQDEARQWIESPDLDWSRWPPRVEAVIAGHLAALPDEDRALLQAASVQGEQFAAEVAARVIDWGEETAVRRLSGPLETRHRLVQAVSLDRLPSSGQRLSHYRFRHGLLQRTAYLSLDVVQKARLHEATARVLEAVYGLEGKVPASMAPTLARHFEAAGMPFEAAGYRLEAGRWAANLVEYEEAIAHLNCGLALLDGIPPSTERLRLELGLCAALCTPALLQRGWQSPAHMQSIERLAGLIQHPDLQDDPQRVTALSVLVLSANWSADPGHSESVGKCLLGLTQEGDQQTLLLGHWALGLSYWLQGKNSLAREHLDRTVALYDLKANRPLSGFLVGDLGVMAGAILGAVLWLLGYPDQGRAGLRQAVARAQALEQPSSLAFAHYVATMVISVIGHDGGAAVSHARALRPLSQRSMIYRNWSEIVEELSQAQDQHAAECAEFEPQAGLARMVTAGSNWQTAGAGAGFAALMLLQAGVCARSGQVEMGLGALDQAQAWIESTGMRATEAEAWRVRGELLLIDRPGRPAQVEEAEACFGRALALAREQGSRWWELGAALNLARLWQAQGRREQARDLLAGICDWFTEGFDTLDLIEATALLEALA